MKKEKEQKTIEREYVIPLREKYRHVPRYKKTPKAVKIVKEFLARHMKVYDRDLKKIRIDKYLNEFLWLRGIKKPPAKIKVKAIKENDIVRVEIVEMPDKLKFKKLREEKKEKEAKEFVEKKKGLMQKAKEAIQAPETKEKTEEEKKEEKEKKSAVVEEGRKLEKAAAKKMKHSAEAKTRQPKHKKRMALAK
jgi:large subunit ribosomal protein L31e